MTRVYRGDRKSVLVANGGVAVTAIATAFTVASSATTDFPGPGTATFEVQATGETIIVTAGLGTTSWSAITRGGNQTTAAIIPDGSVLLEINGSNDLNNFLQKDASGLTTSLLASTTPIVDGVGAVGTSTLAARADHVHPTSGGGAGDATTSSVGSVEVDHAPSGAHPIAMTLDGLAIATGMLGAGTPAADGVGAAGTAVQASRSDHVHPLPAHIAATGSAPAIATGVGLGTTPPTPTIAGNDQRGTVTFGTGTATPANGAAIMLTFNVAYAAAPVIALTSANSATALLTGQWYVSAISTTAATLSFSGTFAASQGATVYKVNYVAIG